MPSLALRALDTRTEEKLVVREFHALAEVRHALSASDDTNLKDVALSRKPRMTARNSTRAAPFLGEGETMNRL